MRQRAVWRILAVLAALGVWLGGCGDDDSGSDAQDTGADADADGDGDVGADADGDDDLGADADGDDDAALPDVVEDDGATTADPSAAGPYTWTTIDDSVTRGSRTTPVSALLPDVPAGERRPLILFLPGFQMRTVWYLPYCEHLASHGFAVVRADPPASLLDNNHPELALDAQAVLDWALDPAGAVEPHVDAEHVGASGHSNGGKISTMLAAADPRVKGLFLLDPINGRGPSGFNPSQPDIIPERVEPLAIPLGFVGETVDVVGGFSGQACAPAELNFLTFFDAASSSPWTSSWEIPGADHADFVYDAAACGFYCRLCVEGTTDPAVTHAVVNTLGAAFFRAFFYGEPEMEQWLTGDRMPADLLLQHRP